MREVEGCLSNMPRTATDVSPSVDTLVRNAGDPLNPRYVIHVIALPNCDGDILFPKHNSLTLAPLLRQRKGSHERIAHRPTDDRRDP